MRRQLLVGLRMTIALTVVLGLLYPLAVAALARVTFKDRADGSLVVNNAGAVIGSSLIGQNFVGVDGRPDPRYFQPRPSAAGTDGYDPLGPSGGTNLGPSNQKLLDAVALRVTDYRTLNRLDPSAAVPVDAVTASGSGLDPNISVANAKLQAARVADARGLSIELVERLIDQYTQPRQWGVLGEKVVNVLELNLALDQQH
jgi:K+-transporting ATPase ATPase C chain